MSLTAKSSHGARQQSTSGPPVQEFVTVAVLPPRLPPDMAPPTGVGPADVFSWDESVNWVHNEPIEQKAQEPTGAKKWMRKAGITTQRKKALDTPPFIMRQVPYDIWRKHYAKDKDGRFKGTGTPAEDCLLLPEDVEKWRLGEPETKGDLWTRGKAALPAYADTQTSDEVPEYTERAASDASQPLPSASAQSQRVGSSFTADGKTSEQIIQEAKDRSEANKNQKGGWKNTMKRAGEYTLMGTNI